VAPEGEGEGSAACEGAVAADLALAAALQAELRAAGERVALIAHCETIQIRWIRRLAVTWLHCAGSGKCLAAPAAEATRARARVLPLEYAGGLVAAHDGVRARYKPAAAPRLVRAADSEAEAGVEVEALLSTAGVRGVSAEEHVARLRAVYGPWLENF
jgi:hypothetical protein